MWWQQSIDSSGRSTRRFVVHDDAIGAELGAAVKILTEIGPQNFDGFNLGGFGSRIDGFKVYLKITCMVTEL